MQVDAKDLVPDSGTIPASYRIAIELHFLSAMTNDGGKI